MRILQVVHGFPPSGTGGAELYAEALARGLAAAGHDVAVFTREAVTDRHDGATRDEHRDGLHVRWVNNTFRSARSFEDTYANPSIDHRVAAFLDLTRPDVAHVHHLTCLSTGIVDVLARANVPTVLHLHDYWLLCHRGQLLDTRGERCSGPGSTGCASCTGLAAAVPAAAFRAAPLLRSLRSALPSPLVRRTAAVTIHTSAAEARSREQSRRRLEHMRQRFAAVDLAMAPSSHVKSRFAEAGFDAGRIEVSEYGVNFPPAQPRRAGDRPLRLGFLGTLMLSKAPHLLVEAIERLPPGSVEAAIFGAPAAYHGDTTYSDRIGERLRHPAVTVHGSLAHHDVPAALASIDVLVFPSIWEETSGIGAREALAAGVPVVASRIGGIPEFVTHDRNGLLFTPGDSDDLARQLRRLLDEPDLLPRLRTGISPVRSFANDLQCAISRYESLIAMRRTRRAAPRVAAVVLNYRTPDETANAVAWLTMARPALESIIVVDNGDGTELRAALGPFPQITVLTTGRNLGFPAGCNVGIRAALDAGADAVFLVNSDVAVPPTALDRLVAALTDGAGIVAPIVRDRARPDVIQSAGIAVSDRTGRMRAKTILPPDDDGRRDAVSGCAMLVDRRVFEAVGLLPEPYFFGFEDIAFCRSASAAGFNVRLCRGASVMHAAGGTMGTSPDRFYYGTRNHLRLSRQMPARSPLHRAARSAAIAGYSLAYAIKSSGASLPARVAAVAHGVFDHLRGIGGARR